MPPSTRGRAEVVFVLLSLQAGACLLGMVGLLLIMGSPLYAAGSVARAAVLLVLAAKIVRGRQWALVGAIVLEWAGLFGTWVGLVLGLLPGLTPALTLTGVLTGIGMPVAVGWLCARLLAARPRAAADPPTVPIMPIMPVNLTAPVGSR